MFSHQIFATKTDVPKTFGYFEVAMAPVKNQDAFAERNGQVPWDPTISIDHRDRVFTSFFWGPLKWWVNSKGNSPLFQEHLYIGW